LYVIPWLGSTRIDRLRVRDVQTWVNKLAVTCQCCAQGKDAARVPGRRRCCAIGQCCESYPGKRTVQAARNTLRAALSQAVIDELVPRNVASLVKLPSPPKRRRKGTSWSVPEASQFLESARSDQDPLYAAYVLILVLGLRKGEMLGLPWPAVNFGTSELDVSWQLQRIRGNLIHKKRTKADSDQSGDVLPLPDVCTAALELRQAQQAADATGTRWLPVQLAPSGLTSGDLVFTTTRGTVVDPRNFNRRFNSRCEKAGVRRIRVHDTRHTFAAFMTTAGAAVDGREAVTAAASLPPPGAGAAEPSGPAPAAGLDEVIGVMSMLATLLADRLTHAAALATVPDDRAACEEAAAAARRICQLTARHDDGTRLR